MTMRTLIPKITVVPATKNAYNPPEYVLCPICDKILGEWVEVRGEATIREWCRRCRKFVDITKRY